MLTRAANLPPSPPRSPRYDKLYERGMNSSPREATSSMGPGSSQELPTLSLGPSEREKMEAEAIAQTETLVRGRARPETPGQGEQGDDQGASWQLLLSAVAVSAAVAYAVVRVRQGKGLVQ